MKTLLFLLTLLILPSDAANVGGQLKNAQLENRGSDYASGVRGRVWYRTDLGLCRYDDGSTIRELLTTNVAQVVTAKDIDGGTASNTSRVTLPKAATATLNGLARKEATVVYDTTTKEVKADDGTNLVPQMPVGTILHYGGSSAPNGYLLGNGAAVSRTTYAALFAVVGTSFGVGDGATTFNLPNCQRRTLVGAGGVGSGTLGNTVGSVGGTETETLVEANLPAHTHTVSGTSGAGSAHTHGVTDPGHAHTQRVAQNNSGGAFCVYQFEDCDNTIAYHGDNGSTQSNTTGVTVGSESSHTHSFSAISSSVGSGTAVNNLQPSLVVNCIIKH
jgi:microcystin-dependent protein